MIIDNHDNFVNDFVLLSIPILMLTMVEVLVDVQCTGTEDRLIFIAVIALLVVITMLMSLCFALLKKFHYSIDACHACIAIVN